MQLQLNDKIVFGLSRGITADNTVTNELYRSPTLASNLNMFAIING